MCIQKSTSRFALFKKLLLVSSVLPLFFSSLAFATVTYQLSVFLDMSPSSPFAQQYCPLISGVYTCAVEGSAVDSKGNLYLSMALPKGEIFKVTPAGTPSIYATFPLSNATNPTATDFDGVNLRLAFDSQDVLYATYIDVNNPTAKVPTAYTGLWKIPQGGGNCSLTSGPCVKIWPQTTPSPLLRFPDGLVLDNFGNIYVADAQMGNIWKVNRFTGQGTLWAGVDANSNPNYLEGNPDNIVLGFSTNPAVNRGLGIVGLTIDNENANLYASTFDGGSVVQIPINFNGSAGKQKVLLNLLPQDYQLDAIYLDKATDILYTTHDNSQFNALIASIFSGGPIVPPLDGHEIYAAFVGFGNPVFQSIINDPTLGVTTGVVHNPNTLDPFDLYVDVYGSVQGATTPKILKANPMLSF